MKFCSGSLVRPLHSLHVPLIEDWHQQKIYVLGSLFDGLGMRLCPAPDQLFAPFTWVTGNTKNIININVIWLCVVYFHVFRLSHTDPLMKCRENVSLAWDNLWPWPRFCWTKEGFVRFPSLCFFNEVVRVNYPCVLLWWWNKTVQGGWSKPWTQGQCFSFSWSSRCTVGWVSALKVVWRRLRGSIIDWLHNYVTPTTFERVKLTQQTWMCCKTIHINKVYQESQSFTVLVRCCFVCSPCCFLSGLYNRSSWGFPWCDTGRCIW